MSYKLQTIRGTLGLSYVDTKFLIQLYFPYLKISELPGLQSFGSMGFMSSLYNQGTLLGMPARYTYVSSPRDFTRVVESGKISIFHLFDNTFESHLVLDVYIVQG